MIAARWLAADLVDTESVRMLAGEDPRDPWALERLLADSVSEANVTVPSDPQAVQRIAIDWVTTAGVRRETPAGLLRSLLISARHSPSSTLDCSWAWTMSWIGGWGRLEPDLKVEAMHELDRLLHGGGTADSRRPH
jgi:hypothetical protein